MDQLNTQKLLIIAVNAFLVSSSDDRCTDLQGICLNSDVETCEIGTFQSGMCDGASNRKCCLVDDYMCVNNDGFCQNDLECQIGNHLVKGYCETDVRSCCVPGEPLDCPLTLWKSNNIIGYNGKDVYQSVSLYQYSTVPYSTASCQTPEKLKIQYRTQYSRNTANTAEHSEFRVIVPVFTVIFRNLLEISELSCNFNNFDYLSLTKAF